MFLLSGPSKDGTHSLPSERTEAPSREHVRASGDPNSNHRPLFQFTHAVFSTTNS